MAIVSHVVIGSRCEVVVCGVGIGNPRRHMRALPRRYVAMVAGITSWRRLPCPPPSTSRAFAGARGACGCDPARGRGGGTGEAHARPGVAPRVVQRGRGRRAGMPALS